MRARVLTPSSVIVLSAALLVVALSAVMHAGQQPPAKPAVAKAETWTPPRTPDGQPDLQGMWTNATITPFERPRELAGKAFLTEEEAAKLELQAAERRETADERPPRAGHVGSEAGCWCDPARGVVATREASLERGPREGRVPLKPGREKQRDCNLSNLHSLQRMSPWDR